MKWTNKISDELLDYLTPYSNWFFNQDLSELDTITKNPGRMAGYTLESACGSDYLKMILEKDNKHIGFPEHTMSIDLQGDERTPQLHRDKCREMGNKVTAFLGSKNQAVNVYYPENGFMSWHNNWNAHGYNILLSYSQTGNGFFRYRDPITKEVITMPDKVGWSCKVGYFGRGRETDKVFYHCAGSLEKRLTLGFIVPHLEIWRNMIEDISGEDASSFT